LRSDEEDNDLNDGEDEVDQAEGMKEARIARKKGTGPNGEVGDAKLGGAHRGDGLASNGQKKLEEEKELDENTMHISQPSDSRERRSLFDVDGKSKAAGRNFGMQDDQPLGSAIDRRVDGSHLSSLTTKKRAKYEGSPGPRAEAALHSPVQFKDGAIETANEANENQTVTSEANY